MKESELFKTLGKKQQILWLRISLKFEVIGFLLVFREKEGLRSNCGASELSNRFSCLVFILFVDPEVATYCCLV